MKKKRSLSTIGLFLLGTFLLCGCATAPGAQQRIASTSFGLGAFGTALGYAITGDPYGAALGGLSGLAGGYLLGTAAENRSPVVVPPPPPGASRYYTPQGPPYRSCPDGTNCRTVRTIIRENGQVVADYEREVCGSY